MKVTLEDIASKCGCSVATASRALSGNAAKYRISEDTVRKVREEASRQKYRPLSIAQKQRKERSSMIGLLLPSVANPYFADMASVIISELYRLNYTSLVMDTMEDESRFEESAKELLARNVEGIIAVPCGSDPFLLEQIDAEVPVVLIDRYYEESSLSYVTTGNYKGAGEATRILIGNGHRKIACIQGVLSSMPNKERVKGFLDAVKEAGIGAEAQVVGSDFSIQNGYLETKLLLNSGSRPTAIFALSNTILLGAIKAIGEAGLRIPEDISVISFDDNPYLDFITPAISRMGQPIEDMAKLAVKILVGKIQSPSTSSRLLLSPRYLPGKSIAILNKH